MYLEKFKMPKPTTISGRTSSITNAFINGIVPCIEPTEDEVQHALSLLNMDAQTICCSYCGDTYTEWDHLNPLIVNKKATGYISEISNLVPACGKCNQSKGNKQWKTWMLSNANLSPATRGVTDIENRILCLDRYEVEMHPKCLDFVTLVGEEKWNTYETARKQLIAEMENTQKLSSEIKRIVLHAYQNQKWF